MFKLKKYLLIFNIILFIVLGLFLITNNVHQVMAVNSLNDENSINNEINKLFSERKLLATKISYFCIYHLDDDIKLQKQLDNLDQTIQNFYQKLSDIKFLNYINEQIRYYSYERNQIAIKSLENPTIQEFKDYHQKLVEKINNLRQKYINLQYKLNE